MKNSRRYLCVVLVIANISIFSIFGIAKMTPSKSQAGEFDYHPEVQDEKFQIEFQKTSIDFGRAILQVEIADTPKKVQRGLMYRRSLAANHGMIFVYPKEMQLSFWNKNTFIDLDLAYFDSKGVLIQVQKLHALSSVMESPSHFPSARPALFAIESQHGWFQANDLRPGLARIPTEVLKRLRFRQDVGAH
jgi:uncharacterized membrane protein (UPF0127 family)